MNYLTSLGFALLVTAPFFAPTPYLEGKEFHKDVSQINKPATIKILIAQDKSEVLLEIQGRYQIYNPIDGMLVDTGILGKRSPIAVADDGITWANILPTGLRQFRIVPGDSQSKILVNGVQYLGCIEAYEHNGLVTIVNELDVENYLKSTLAPLFSSEKNQELLDAIAITARTQIYYTLVHNFQAEWQVKANEVGYQGFALAHQNARLDKSIDNTKHMIMTHNQNPFFALWTKDSAGKTASINTILRKESNAPAGVQIPLALRDREKRSWSLTITKEQLAHIADVKNINGLDLFLDQLSGKVYALRIHDGLTTKDIDFFTLQTALGSKKVRSNDFTVSLKKDNIILSGFGEGPGAGLCLYSARLMAERGDKATKILSTFFPETQLERKREIR